MLAIADSSSTVRATAGGTNGARFNSPAGRQPVPSRHRPPPASSPGGREVPIACVQCVVYCAEIQKTAKASVAASFLIQGAALFATQEFYTDLI
jgi:hypothetical protein